MPGLNQCKRPRSHSITGNSIVLFDGFCHKQGIGTLYNTNKNYHIYKIGYTDNINNSSSDYITREGGNYNITSIFKHRSGNK
jgi:hypothetical protein